MIEMLMQFLLATVGIILVLPFVLLVLDLRYGTHMSCDWYGWHDGSGAKKTFDGCSWHSTCHKCGKDVMQDGQGNWF